MKDKEKQIEVNKIIELIKSLNIVCDNNDCEKCPCSVKNKFCTEERVARVIIEHYQPRLPENARVFIPTNENYVMLSREEYQDLKEYKNIAEQRKFNLDYANVELRRLETELKRVKAHAKINDEHLHIRIKNQSSKETAEKFAKEFDKLLTEKLRAKREFICFGVKWYIEENTLYNTIYEVKDELAKQFGVEIKE